MFFKYRFIDVKINVYDFIRLSIFLIATFTAGDILKYAVKNKEIGIDTIELYAHFILSFILGFLGATSFDVSTNNQFEYKKLQYSSFINYIWIGIVLLLYFFVSE
jgi:hypothetical protein